LIFLNGVQGIQLAQRIRIYYFQNQDLKDHIKAIVSYAEQKRETLLLKLNDIARDDNPYYFAISGFEHFIYQKHYQTFIDHVGAPYKIRLKAMSNVRWLLPHSDRYNNENGDACSIHIALDVNNEITNWYQFEGQFKMFNPLHVARLKKQKSIQLKNGQACLFDNQSIHSVTNCHPNKTRWCLSIVGNILIIKILLIHF
jgi:hypothetical protein